VLFRLRLRLPHLPRLQQQLPLFLSFSFQQQLVACFPLLLSYFIDFLHFLIEFFYFVLCVYEVDNVTQPPVRTTLSSLSLF
jgi:hypothetical protein